jgi:biotin operon repressor
MTEQVTMTREEMRRWHVVEKVVEGMVSGRAAGEALGIGERQVWRLVVRVRKEGASGVVNRGGGKKAVRRGDVA